MTDAAATCSFAAFARLNGWRKSYVSQLKDHGRLVLTDDGKAVRVAESLARIEATADPSRAAVAARHAAARASAATTPAATVGEGADAPEGQEAAPSSGYTYWRERTEKAKALQAERENAAAEGKLLEATDVANVVGRAAATLRTSLENLPVAMAPELAAETDEARVRALLHEAIEHALAEASRQFATLSKEQTP